MGAAKSPGEKKITGMGCILIVFLTALALVLELILTYIIELLFALTMDYYAGTQYIIIFWIVICIIWLAAGVFIIRLAKKKYAFDVFERRTILKGASLWLYS